MSDTPTYNGIPIACNDSFDAPGEPRSDTKQVIIHIRGNGKVRHAGGYITPSEAVTVAHSMYPDRSIVFVVAS